MRLVGVQGTLVVESEWLVAVGVADGMGRYGEHALRALVRIPSALLRTVEQVQIDKT